MQTEEFEKYMNKLEEVSSKLIKDNPKKEEDINLYLKYLAEVINFVLKNTIEIHQIKGAKYLQLQEKIYTIGRIKDKDLTQPLDSLIMRHKKDVFPIICANSSTPIFGLLIDAYS